jgi:acetyl-CoA carboxylase biotin carboxyl carrier protein
MPDPVAPLEADRSPGAEVAELIGLIDRLEELLERSALTELEVEAGDTTLVLRKPEALSDWLTLGAPGSGIPSGSHPTGAPAVGAVQPADEAATGLRAVVSPLTGVFYLSPSPGAAPYVREGGEVNVGQVIGLVEAMKLFNEIKSDVSGIVRRIAADSGALVKARQTLIEVEPA